MALSNWGLFDIKSLPNWVQEGALDRILEVVGSVFEARVAPHIIAGNLSHGRPEENIQQVDAKVVRPSPAPMPMDHKH